MGQQRYPQVLDTVTIASGAALSGETRDLGGNTITGLDISGWTGAAVSFDAAEITKSPTTGNETTGTYRPLYNSTGEVTIASLATASGGYAVALTPSDFVSFRKFKIRSGTSGSTTNQGGARTIKILGRPLS